MAVPTSSTTGSIARQRAASIRPVSQCTMGTRSRSATSSISAMTGERSGRMRSRYSWTCCSRIGMEGQATCGSILSPVPEVQEELSMPDVIEVPSGLEGVVAFHTSIAEPDKEGSALRYRGVDIEELVGNVPFEKVWGLLVDGSYEPGLPPAEPHPLSVRTGSPRVDLQAALAMLAPQWGLEELIDISDDQARTDLARVSVMALSFVAQAARVGQPPVPQREVDRATSIPERFLIRWRGEADPRHVKAIDAYWISAAEHGMNASTFTARVVASTGADVATALSAAV